MYFKTIIIVLTLFVTISFGILTSGMCGIEWFVGEDGEYYRCWNREFCSRYRYSLECNRTNDLYITGQIFLQYPRTTEDTDRVSEEILFKYYRSKILYRHYREKGFDEYEYFKSIVNRTK